MYHIKIIKLNFIYIYIEKRGEIYFEQIERNNKNLKRVQASEPSQKQ